MPEPEKKRTRAKRRNFEKELLDLKAYCQAHVEVLSENTQASEYERGKVIAFRQVLAKIEITNGK